jgi:WD40 repeat protein
MVLARENGKPIFPIKVKSCELPDLLSAIQVIDLTVDKESGYRRLAAGLKQQGLDPADVFDPDPTRPPYPGFPAFEEADAALFFGRSAEILSARETLEGLRRHSRDVPRLVLVLGSSGSGKSSLVRAGLIPRLKKDEKNWLPLRPFRPQDERNPLDALAFALADTYKDLHLSCDSDFLRRRLRSAADSVPVDSEELLIIARELASAAARREATVLVTVDQAEELLNSESSETGKTFLRFLGASLSACDRHLMAIATTRSDFLGVFQNRIASLESPYRLGLQHRPLTVEPIPIERYAELIKGPARLTGLQFQESLVRKLLQDAGQPDSLPLLAFTLRRLYDLHFEGPQANRHAELTLREYEELGGLAGAVQNAAERIFEGRQPSTDEIKAFRETFIPGLIRYNEDRSYSRRRALWRELPNKAATLLDGFVDARILVAGADKDAQPTVEIAHEALLRTWPALVGWLIEDRDKLRQYNAIVRAAKDWDEGGRNTDLLIHRDGRLKDATELISEQRFSFGPESVERAYLEVCIIDQHAREAAVQEERERRMRDAQRLAQAERERAEEAEKRAQEQKQAASKLRRRALAATGAAITAVLAFILAGIGWFSAERMRQSALSSKLATDSELLRKQVKGSFGDLSLLLALEGFLRSRSVETELALRSAIDFVPRQIDSLTFDAKPKGLAFSPDGRFFACWAADIVRVWALSEKKPYDIRLTQPPLAVAFSTDSSQLVAIPEVGPGTILDLSSWKESQTALESASGPLAPGFFFRDGFIWPIGGSHPVAQPLPPGAGNYAAISPAGDLLAISKGDKEVSIAGIKGQVRCRLHPDPVTVNSAELSPDGKAIFVGEYDTTARVWSTETGELVARFDHVGDVACTAFSPDGRLLATGASDAVHLWEIATGRQVMQIPAPGTKVVAFSSDGREVAVAGESGAITLWDTSRNRRMLRIPGSQRLFTVLIDPNATLLCANFGSRRAVYRIGRNGLEPTSLEGNLGVAFSPDGRNISRITRASPAGFDLLDASTLSPVRTLLRSEHVESLAFSPNGRFAFCVHAIKNDESSSVGEIWDIRTGTSQGSVRLMHASFQSACANDGHSFATTEKRMIVSLWRLGSDQPIWQEQVQESEEAATQMVGGIAFSSDNQYVAWVKENGTLKLAKASTGAIVFSILLDSSTFGLAFSPDGHSIFTRTTAKVVRAFEVPGGREIHRFEQDLPARAIAVSPDGAQLATIGGDTAGNMWDISLQTYTLDGDKLVVDACARLNRDLTAEEWERYFPGEPWRSTHQVATRPRRKITHGL